MTTRKTLKDFFQSRGSVQSDISINPTDTSGDGSLNEGDDLGKDAASGEELLDLEDNTTGLLGDYVSFLMSSYDHESGTFNGKVSNFYRPGPKNSKAPNSNRGNRVHSPLGPDGQNKAFADENTSLGKSLFKYSNSGYISNLDSIVKKEGDPSNNNILSFDTLKNTSKGETFVNQQIDQDVVGETLDTFKGYNRYYPSKNAGDGLAYSEKGISNSDSTSQSSISMYNQLGNSEELTDKLRLQNLFNLVPDILQKYTGISMSDIEGKTLDEIEEAFTNIQNQKISSKDLKANLQNSIPSEITEDGYQISKNDMLTDERLVNVLPGDYSDIVNENPMHLIYLGSVRLKIIISLISFYFEENNISLDRKRSGYIKRIRGNSNIEGIIDTVYKISDCIDEGFHIMFKSSFTEEFSFSDILSNKNMSESKYFWVAMFKQIIKDSDRLLNVLETSNSKDFLTHFSKSRIAQFTNIIARIGDLSLTKTNGKGLKIETENPATTNILDMDNMPDNLSTIISKNKDKEGKVSWNQGSTPSMYLMPGSVNSAAFSLGTGITGANPLRASLNGRLGGETYITPAEGDFSKIPTTLVERLENQLEASYVPFYFHDLRTNEIISFHAFLNQLSDSFMPGYNPVSGYGRMDPVQIYRSTTRAINVGFTIAATSKKDFNEMWWKINKLLTLLYPKWSKGTRVFDEDSGNHFIQPFSQVIEASPMIRLRVGDVIKSNYSELSLARKFGIGNIDTIITGRPGKSSIGFLNSKGAKITKQILNKAVELIMHTSIMLALGSPIATYQLGSDLLEYALKGSESPLSNAVASLLFDTRGAALISKSHINSLNLQSEQGKKIYNKFLNPNIHSGKGPVKSDRIILAVTLPDFPYYSQSDKRYYHIKTSLNAEIIKTVTVENEIMYVVQIIDLDAPGHILGKELLVRFEDFILSPEHLFLQNLEGFAEDIKEFISETEEGETELLSNLGISNTEVDLFKSLLSSAVFMSPYASAIGNIVSMFGADVQSGNPFVKAFNSTKGRGLAGFINSFSIDLMSEDSTWDLDYNSRAPKLVKITFGFAPVHDITPGIDYSGFNTSPIYNVGDIMKDAAGDVWSANDFNGKRIFKKSGAIND